MYEFGEDVSDNRASIYTMDKLGSKKTLGTLTYSIQVVELLRQLSGIDEDLPAIAQSDAQTDERVRSLPTSAAYSLSARLRWLVRKMTFHTFLRFCCVGETPFVWISAKARN